MKSNLIIAIVWMGIYYEDAFCVRQKLRFISCTAADKAAAEITSVYHEDKDIFYSLSLLSNEDFSVLCPLWRKKCVTCMTNGTHIRKPEAWQEVCVLVSGQIKSSFELKINNIGCVLHL